MKDTKMLCGEIVDIEWEMFYATQNIGGQASCQQNRGRFEIMRHAQFENWDGESLENYLADLKSALARGDNLVTLKYAYLRASTDPAGYARIAHMLPEISAEKREIVERLTARTVEWCEAFAAEYPAVSGRGRSIRSSEDNMFNTSVETYSRGEFSSYGMDTLRSLVRHYEMLAAEGKNLHKMVAASEMRMLGYESMDAAEAAARGH
ncbi:MAG: DUF4125 family protein [Clostridia bacterium]|nr:DUF4125 family protein [Clostridia bacterium]